MRRAAGTSTLQCRGPTSTPLGRATPSTRDTSPLGWPAAAPQRHSETARNAVRRLPPSPATPRGSPAEHHPASESSTNRRSPVPRDARHPDGLARPRSPYSPVVVSGDHVFTAGQVAVDADGALVPGGIEEQTRQVLANVRSCLRAGGCDLDDVVRVLAFLSYLDDFD